MESDPRAQRLVDMVDRYQAQLLRLCYLVLHDTMLAEDAVQETFLKAYRAMGRFRGDCQEKTWLMRIAINTCRDMRRSAWLRHTDRSVFFTMLRAKDAGESQPLEAVRTGHDFKARAVFVHIDLDSDVAVVKARDYTAVFV